MKKIIQLLIIMIVTAVLHSCQQKQREVVEVRSLNTKGMDAVGAYFTKDEKGNSVLCWTEKESKDALYHLKYAVYSSQHNSFLPPVTVSVSTGAAISPESMGKIAFKSDGTVIALFGKRFEKEKNPFAGAIYYSLSVDKGKSWSKAQYLHSDTSHAYGRSFFDVSRTKDGELAVVWLDGRFGKSVKGSALFFARTEKGKGFALDTCLDKGTCECCRTNIIKDQNNDIHIAYRSIMFPSNLFGKQVRDMVYIRSNDNGKTFSHPKTISEDNWEIEGCPHSGPSLAITKNSVNGVWFTAGGSSGIYYTQSSLGTAFKKRSLVTASGRHPQMVSVADGKVAVVCEEAVAPQPEKPMKMNHSQGAMKMTHLPASPAKIVLRILKDGHTEKTLAISDGQASDHHAVITPLNEGLLLAWIREDHAHSKIYYARVKN